MASSTTGSTHGETCVIGNRYKLYTIAANPQYVTQEGHEVARPERKVRAKGYAKPTDEAGRSELSMLLKNQMTLNNIAARLEQKLRQQQQQQHQQQVGVEGSAANGGGDGTGKKGDDAAGGGSGGSGGGVTDREMFLLSCFYHTRLLTDRVQTSSHVYAFKDWMPCSLQTILSNGRLDEDGALYYLFQLLKAVYYLHENGFVHRNISAEHIYISSSGAQLRLGGVSSLWYEGRSDDGTPGGSGSTRSPTPQPGSYGICSKCGRDVPIVTEPRSSGGELSGGGDGASADAPPLNTITTPCRYCGTMQNRMHLLQTIVGTPAFLPPEAIAYQPLQSAMSTGNYGGGSNPLLSSSSSLANNTYNASGATHPGTGVTSGQARDMWSCGVVLYFMLTCRLPFDPRNSSHNHNNTTSNNNNASVSVGGGMLNAASDFTLTPQQTWDMCNRIAAVEYTFPSYVAEGARQVIAALLVRNPRERPTAAQLMSWPCFDRLRMTNI